MSSSAASGMTSKRKFRPIAPKDCKAFRRATFLRRQTSRRVFGDANMVLHMLGFLGPGYWLIAAPVCKQWCQSYADALRLLFLDGQCQPPPRRTLYSTAFASPAAVQWDYACGLQFDGFTASIQRRIGLQADKATLLEALRLDLPYCIDLVRGAAAAGNLQTLQILHCIGGEGRGFPDDISCIAAGSGSIPVLRWSHTLGVKFDKDTCTSAVRAGHLHVLQYLCFTAGCELLPEHAEAAAQCSNLYILSWLHCKGCSVPATVAREAASRGNVPMLRWLFMQKELVPNDELTLAAAAAAAAAGQLDTCKYLCSMTGVWGFKVLYAAAHSGQLDTLRWLYEQGCPLDLPFTTVQAGCSGSIDTIAFMLHLVLTAIPELYNSLLWQVLRSTSAQGHLVAAQWTRQQGALWPATLEFEERRWTGAVLLWAREQGCSAALAADDADLVISDSEDSSSSSTSSGSSSGSSSSSDNRVFTCNSARQRSRKIEPDYDDYYDYKDCMDDISDYGDADEAMCDIEQHQY
jgi:hypothetical protein